MPIHEVAIHFKHSGSSSHLYSGSTEYRSGHTGNDTLKVYNKYLAIEALRSKESKDPLRFHNSTLYKQILKSLCLYYILARKANQIKSISIHVRRSSGTMDCISEMRDGIRQVLRKSCDIGVLGSIQTQRAALVLQETEAGRSVFYAATYLIKSLDVQSSVERFEKLWRAFNALYRASAGESVDHVCHRLLRQRIMSNPSEFPLSIAKVSALTRAC